MITRKGYKRYQTILQAKRKSKILEKKEIQESCNTWMDKVQNTIKQVEKTKIKKAQKDIRKLQQKRRKLKIETNYQKQTRKPHTIRKREDPQRAHYR